VSTTRWSTTCSRTCRARISRRPVRSSATTARSTTCRTPRRASDAPTRSSSSTSTGSASRLATRSTALRHRSSAAPDQTASAYGLRAEHENGPILRDGAVLVCDRLARGLVVGLDHLDGDLPVDGLVVVEEFVFERLVA